MSTIPATRDNLLWVAQCHARDVRVLIAESRWYTRRGAPKSAQMAADSAAHHARLAFRCTVAAVGDGSR